MTKKEKEEQEILELMQHDHAELIIRKIGREVLSATVAWPGMDIYAAAPAPSRHAAMRLIRKGLVKSTVPINCGTYDTSIGQRSIYRFNYVLS